MADMVNTGACWKCKCETWIPRDLYNAAQATKGDEHPVGFYCPYGHRAVFVAGETEETKLRRERDRLKQENARLDEAREFALREAKAAQERATKAEAKAKRLTKRAAAGTCPCCKRTFAELAQHMKHQHPEFVQETGAKVVQIKSRSKAA